MSEVVSFRVPGVPTAKGRARATRNGRHYTPAKTRDAEANVLAAWLAATGMKRVPHDGPVALQVSAFFPIPKSWPKGKRKEAHYHLTKPDLDNLVKLVKDALNGHAYVDDSAVVKLSAVKTYTVEEPFSLIELTFYPYERKQ